MRSLVARVVAITFLVTLPAWAQAPEPQPPEPPPVEEMPIEEAPVEIETDEIQTDEPPPAPAAVEAPPVLSQAAGSAYERRESLPDVNIYVPEMQMSIRLRKLIRNALFESQIDYEFVDGDISTYLRYKYYARNYTYRIGVFDTIEFRRSSNCVPNW